MKFILRCVLLFIYSMSHAMEQDCGSCSSLFNKTDASTLIDQLLEDNTLLTDLFPHRTKVFEERAASLQKLRKIFESDYFLPISSITAHLRKLDEIGKAIEEDLIILKHKYADFSSDNLADILKECEKGEELKESLILADDESSTDSEREDFWHFLKMYIQQPLTQEEFISTVSQIYQAAQELYSDLAKIAATLPHNPHFLMSPPATSKSKKHTKRLKTAK